MAITFRAVATAGGSGTSPRTVIKPTGTVEGDTMFLHVALTTGETPTVPDGFILVDGATAVGTYTTTIYRKVAGASEPASYDVSFSAGLCAVGMLTLTAPSPVVAHAVAARVNASDTNRIWDGVTNSLDNTVLCCFGSFSASYNTSSDGAMTERYDPSGTPRPYLMMQEIAAAGATGTRTATAIGAVNSANVTISMVDNVLSAPSSLSAVTASASQIDLAWEDGGVDLDGISIEHSDDGVSDWAEIDTVAAGVEAYGHTGLTRSTPHYYRVRAFQN